MKSPFEEYEEFYPIVKREVEKIVGFYYGFTDDLVQETFIHSENRFQKLKVENKLYDEYTSFIGMTLRIARDVTIKFINYNSKKDRTKIIVRMEDDYLEDIIKEPFFTQSVLEEEAIQQEEMYNKIDKIYEYAELLGISREELFGEMCKENTSNNKIKRKITSIKNLMNIEINDSNLMIRRRCYPSGKYVYVVRVGVLGNFFPERTFASLEEAKKYRNKKYVEYIVSDYMKYKDSDVKYQKRSESGKNKKPSFKEGF